MLRGVILDINYQRATLEHSLHDKQIVELGHA